MVQLGLENTDRKHYTSKSWVISSRWWFLWFYIYLFACLFWCRPFLSFFLFLSFFSFIFISWRRTTLQYCSGFCHTLTWISHGFTFFFFISKSSQVALVVKKLPANARFRFDPRFGEISWRRKWQLTVVFLPWEPHGQRSLAGYGPWGLKESDTILQLGRHTQIIPKVFIEFVTILLLFYVLVFWLQGTWGFSFLTRDPSIGRWIPNHWTVWEDPLWFWKSICLLTLYDTIKTQSSLKRQKSYGNLHYHV